MATIKGTAGNDNPLNGTGSADQIYGYGGDDVIDAGDGNDTVYAGEGNDTINGGAGNDFLDGNVGDDTMSGGIGDDVYTVDSAGDVVIENAGEGTDEVRASINYSLVGTEIENLTITGAEGRTATGNDYANKIKGSVGGDNISGLGGNDSISAGDGNDTVDGGAGNDWMDGGDGTDVLSYASATGAVTVSLAISGNQNTGGAGIDNIRNFENLTGSDFNDTLIGSSGNNRLVGGLGDDAMFGGAGDDRYSVDSAGDTVTELSGEGNDTVNSNILSYTLGANVENLILFNAAISGTGNELSNIIRGNDNDNIINGAGGEDHLYGGAGADTFVIDAPDASSVDHLHDFVAGEDVIQVSGAGFGLTSGPLDPSQFVAGSAATEAHGQFIFDSHHNLYWDADGTGAGAAVLIANLGTTTITADNINVGP